MLDLSPTKLIIIFVVVVVLLGPKRLPEVARQLGAGWRKLRELHLQFDRELRQSMPDLPSSQEIVRFARSPVTLLNQLADRHDNGAGVPAEATAASAAPGSTEATEATGSAEAVGSVILESTEALDWHESSSLPVSPPLAFSGLDVDDPNLN